MQFPAQIFFKPNENFWSFMNENPWRYKRYVDIGCGTGYLTMLMRGAGFNIHAIDKNTRDMTYIDDIEYLDATKEWFDFNYGNCMLFARPCHGSFVTDVLRRHIDIGEALYISMKHNVEDDLYDYLYEEVASNVGENNENLYRVLGKKAKIKEYHLLDNGWWEYAPPKYLNSLGAGFPCENAEILDKAFYQHADMIYYELPENHEENKYGWISPEGKVFGCRYTGHDHLAQRILGAEVRELESLGWIRFYEDYYVFPLRENKSNTKSNTKMTNAQYKILKSRGYEVYSYHTLTADASKY